MRYRTLLLILFCACSVGADDYERQPAVDVIHYDLALELPDEGKVVAGMARIQVRMLDEKISRMWLDFEGMTVDQLSIAGRHIPYTLRDGRLAFDVGRRGRAGEVISIESRYHGTAGKSGLLFSENRHKQRVIFAENWPDNAHRWFPCVDHPHDKATVDFAITAPAKYRIVANGRFSGTNSLPNKRTLTRWSEGVPIPTYCMVFGAAEFEVFSSGHAAGVPLDLYYYHDDSRPAAVKFARSKQILEFYARLIGPFPYEKLAQVESTTQIGGMENASAIFYAEGSFAGNPVTESPVPHEVAHQWFGDSVTESDWDHLWLSEGFATYFDALFYEQADGRTAFKGRMEKAAEAIRKLNREQPGPVIDPEQKDPVKKLNAYNYEKGAWVLHMLRGIIGDRAFFKGIRSYYQHFRGKSVVTADFAREMEAAAGLPLNDFFRQWLTQPGWPQYKITWRWNPVAGRVDLEIAQEQSGGSYDMPLEVLLRSGRGELRQKIRVSKQVQNLSISSREKPLQVQIDPEGWVLKSVVVHEAADERR